MSLSVGLAECWASQFSTPDSQFPPCHPLLRLLLSLWPFLLSFLCRLLLLSWRWRRESSSGLSPGPAVTDELRPEGLGKSGPQGAGGHDFIQPWGLRYHPSVPLDSTRISSHLVSPCFINNPLANSMESSAIKQQHQEPPIPSHSAPLEPIARLDY